MHKRQDFKAGDPSWDGLEARWMQTLAAGGTSAEEAFASLYRAYSALFVTRLRFWGMSVDEAMDTSQDLWLEIARIATSWPKHVPVRYFLLGCLKMVRLRHFSSLKLAPAFDSISDEVVMTSAEQAMRSSSSSFEGESEWLDFARCVHRSLLAFGAEHPRMAALLLQRHVEELSLDEMAELVGGSAQHAKAEVFSARRRISPLLQPCLELWPNR